MSWHGKAIVPAGQETTKSSHAGPCFPLHLPLPRTKSERERICVRVACIVCETPGDCRTVVSYQSLAERSLISSTDCTIDGTTEHFCTPPHPAPTPTRKAYPIHSGVILECTLPSPLNLPHVFGCLPRLPSPSRYTDVAERLRAAHPLPLQGIATLLELEPQLVFPVHAPQVCWYVQRIRWGERSGKGDVARPSDSQHGRAK